MKTAVVALVVLWLWPPLAHAHAVQHEVRTGQAVVLELRYADGTPFAYESCEITRVGEDLPLLVSRTDAHGRVAFVPDVAGRFEARVFSEDGHGTRFEFDAATLENGSPPSARPSRWRAALLGLALLGFFFGGLRWWAARRSVP